MKSLSYYWDCVVLTEVLATEGPYLLLSPKPLDKQD